MSGPKAKAVFFSLLAKKPAVKDRTLFIAKLLRSDQKPMDEALCAVFSAPQSYTGEDLIEVHLHGSAFIATQVMEELLRLGVRAALPGEFSFRAVRNGKMDLTQAQAVADLISSSNQAAAELALEKMGGSQNRLVQEMAEKLRTLASMSELGIDFSDQDVEELSLPALKIKLVEVQQALLKLQHSFDRGNKIQEGIQVAFIGLPNSGKSSLFNAFLGEERAIVSDIAGTTRDVLREKITLRGKNASITLRLEDTAGIRTTSDTIESMGIERSLRSAESADLILFLWDLTQAKAEEEIFSVWKKLGAPQNKTVVVLTKLDLVSDVVRVGAEKKINELGIKTFQSVSSLTQDGIKEAIEKIVTHCAHSIQRSPGEVLLTRLEQKHAVDRALAHIDRALLSTEEDLFAADIRQALLSLSPVMGETPTDDLLGRFFSQFCIGK
jgi:tRNA modification GTPase